MKNKLKKIKIKLSVVWNIIFKWDHFFILNLDERNLKKMLREQDFDMDSMYHGLQHYNVMYIMNQIGNSIDQDEMVLQKARFQAKAQMKNEK